MIVPLLRYRMHARLVVPALFSCKTVSTYLLIAVLRDLEDKIGDILRAYTAASVKGKG